MECFNCNEEVDKVVTVYKQLYDKDGLDAGISNSYWCLSCLTNYHKSIEGADSISV